MKRILFAFAFLLTTTASAETMIYLLHAPYGVRICGTPKVETFVSGFNADGTIHGYVRSRSSCSQGGRGGRTLVYWHSGITNWSLTGQVLSTYEPDGTAGPDPTITATDADGNSIATVLRPTSNGYNGTIWTGVLYVPDVVNGYEMTPADALIDTQEPE